MCLAFSHEIKWIVLTLDLDYYNCLDAEKSWERERKLNCVFNLYVRVRLRKFNGKERRSSSLFLNFGVVDCAFVCEIVSL